MPDYDLTKSLPRVKREYVPRGAQEEPSASGGPGEEDEISGSGQRWEACIYSAPEDIFVGTILGMAPKQSFGKRKKKNFLVGPPAISPTPAGKCYNMIGGRGGVKRWVKRWGTLLLLPVKSRTISELGRLPKGHTSLSPLQMFSSLIGSFHGHNVTQLIACGTMYRVGSILILLLFYRVFDKQL